tara:strand:+ start:35042 stop:35671 length:630 start_codon:yes stop_codon:yes gene_type:complete
MKNLVTYDNFLTNEDFNKLTSLKIDNVKETSTKVYHNSISSNGVINNSLIDNELLKKLHSNYHSKAIEILKNIAPKKVDLYDYSEFMIIKSGKNYKFPIHDDTPNKLLSGVIYLYPEKNTGTLFYSDKKGSDRELIDWKPNRAVFFSRIERKTWHSFEGDGKSDRIVLVYNLVAKNLKKVFKVEGTNFIIGYLRYKLNPYIYRIFKKTI